MRKKKGYSGFKKKGNVISDSIMVMVVLLIFILSIFFGNYLLNIWNDDVQADDDMTNLSKEIVEGQHSRYPNFFDGLFMMFFLLIWGLVLVASFKIDTHPIFFIFTVILLIIVFIVAAELGNFYEEIVAEDELVTITAGFPMANYIMSHLLTVIIVIGFSIVLVLFGKNRMNQ